MGTRKIELDNGYIIFSKSDMDENEIIIEKLEVKEKRKGTGTELINKVIDIAIEEGKSISLCAHPLDDSITLDNLILFYESLGFLLDWDDGNVALMKYEN